MVRQKKRYFVVHVDISQNQYETSKKFSFASIKQQIFEKVLDLYGDFGIAAIQDSFFAKYVNHKTQMMIIKAPHGPHKMIASAIPLIRKFDGVEVQCQTLYTGATVKNCFAFLIQYQQRKFDEFVVTLKSAEDIAKLKEALQIDSTNFF